MIDRSDVHSRTKQSIAWFTTLPFAMHILRFANSLLLARILAPSDFGIIGIITVITYYSDTFTDFGFSKAIVQCKEIENAHYFSYFTFNITISLIIFSVFHFFASDIAIYFAIDELEGAIKVFTFVLLITAISAIPKVKLRRELKFKELALVEAGQVMVSMITSLTLALNGYGFWSLIYAMMLSQLLLLFPLLRLAKIIPRPIVNLGPLKELFSFSKWDFIGGQTLLIATNADKLFIGRAFGADQVGFYDKALGLAKMPNDQISIKLANISFSTFSRVQDEPQQLKYYFDRIITLNAVAMVPLLLGLAIISEDFVLTVLGDKWAPMIDSLVIFCFSFIIASFNNPIFSMNLATGKIRTQTIINILLTLFLLATLYLVVSYGIEAVALSMLGFNILSLLFSFTLLIINTSISWRDFIYSVAPALSCSALMLIAIYLFTYLTNFDQLWIEIISSILIGAVVYVIFLLTLPYKSTSFIRLKAINIAKNTLSKKTRQEN